MKARVFFLFLVLAARSFGGYIFNNSGVNTSVSLSKGGQSSHVFIGYNAAENRVTWTMELTRVTGGGPGAWISTSPAGISPTAYQTSYSYGYGIPIADYAPLYSTTYSGTFQPTPGQWYQLGVRVSIDGGDVEDVVAYWSIPEATNKLSLKYDNTAGTVTVQVAVMKDGVLYGQPYDIAPGTFWSQTLEGVPPGDYSLVVKVKDWVQSEAGTWTYSPGGAQVISTTSVPPSSINANPTPTDTVQPATAYPPQIPTTTEKTAGGGVAVERYGHSRD